MTLRRRSRWVVKVGGSLAKAGVLEGALLAIRRLAGEGFHIVVCPGGGAYADFIRSHSGGQGIPAGVAHRQAILSVHQYGHELAWRLAGGSAVSSFRGAMTALGRGAIPVFLPGQSLFASAPQGWEFTSDSMAAVLCRKLGFGGLALLKSADGVWVNGRLLPHATAMQSAKAGLVDPLFGGYLDEKLEAFALNGGKPERLEALIRGGKLEGTRIVAG